MFKTNRSHGEFQIFLNEQLVKYYDDPKFFNTVLNNADVIFKVYCTDLTPVRDILLPTYNPKGEVPWDPVCMFRFYWLMCQYGNSGSITDWVDKLKSEPFWTIVSGFEPGKILELVLSMILKIDSVILIRARGLSAAIKCTSPSLSLERNLRKTRRKPPNIKVLLKGWLIES